ncbi:hypothetical protein [Parvimonas parva]|uniref:Uncharacterized protein n=1 Tax=Parvimonas parva TaxID=2769485 RepID=A0ABS1CAS9_9FIRM|nr:hypothetical protein [Parvimonas parva]MBK1468452.1 hypothetical protein [Parvimonas parva]
MKKIYLIFGSVIIYSILAVSFLYNLNMFNNELGNMSYFRVMFYKNGQAWGYLIRALLFIVLSGWLEFILWKLRKELDIDLKWDVFLWFFCIITIFIFSCLIIYFIQNPILRAAFITILVGFGVVSANN